MIVNSEDAEVVAAVIRIHNGCVRVVDNSSLNVGDQRAGEGERKRMRNSRVIDGHSLSEQQRLSHHESVRQSCTAPKRRSECAGLCECARLCKCIRLCECIRLCKCI